jgi:hypothetical protein
MRSGVGRVTVVDFDTVCIRTFNRQLQALTGTIGMPKASLLAERLRRINPDARVDAIDDHFSEETCDVMLAERPGFLIDAIDHITSKCFLIATCVARFLECGLLLLGTYALRTPIAVRPGQMFVWGRTFLGEFFRTTLPVVLTEVLWSLGVTAYNLVYARMGTDSYAAFSICSTIEGLAFVPFLGLANASAIMIGNKIGAGKDREALADARRFLLLHPGVAGSSQGILPAV